MLCFTVCVLNYGHRSQRFIAISVFGFPVNCFRTGPTCVHTVVCLQLVLEAEPLAAAVALIRLLPGVDALVAPQRPVIPETAPAVFALERVIACENKQKKKQTRGACGPPRRPRESSLAPVCVKGSPRRFSVRRHAVAKGVNLSRRAPSPPLPPHTHVKAGRRCTLRHG